MKKNKILLIIIIIVLCSCSREWKNPLETDNDLKDTPYISKIELDEENGFVIFLNKSYSEEANVLLEKKIVTAFEPIACKRITSSSFADTVFNPEEDYNVTYRVRVEKNGYYTDYSNEKPFIYMSDIIYAPEDFFAASIELVGVRLNWIDISIKEAVIKLRKKMKMILVL